MRKRWLATGVLVALVLAGCGDDDDDSSAATDATTATTAAAAATTSASSATSAAAATTSATTAASATTGAPASTTAASSSATTAAGGSAAPPVTAAGSAAQTACESAVGDISTATTVLDYTLSEFKIDGPTTVAAGKIGLQLDNTGMAAHEIRVLKADNFDDLPKNDNGTLVEDQLPAGSEIGEIDRFPSKSQCTGVFDLSPGTYQLVCNIEFTNGPQVISHAGRGMHTQLTVT